MLRWDWNKRIGRMKMGGTWMNCYAGNAYLIVLHEYQDKGEDLYSLVWFAADKAHMKNMLGLSKGHDNCIKDFGIEEIEVDCEYPIWAEIVQLFIKAKISFKCTVEGREI